ncbi:MAG: SAM-dependent methyltransferase [Alphaproteobacteria bacterium PA4]|nr:MAG: SAM-dependent methyltransferase [Alphaproteobacteria bacterium PA4]
MTLSDNAAQIEYWNGKVGETWVRMQDRMDHALGPVTAALLSLAAPQAGEQVLDVGCGSGETTLALAVAIGDDGAAVGLDVSEPLLARARERADALLLDIDFIAGDAAVFSDDSGYDLIVSRFGVMFFADPVAAFANLFRLAVPGARLCFACWQMPADNLWATLPMTVLADLLPAQPAADPHAPGPFAFADAERVATILTDAGWQDVIAHALPFAMVTGSGDDPVADAVQFSLRIGPAARAVKEAGPQVEVAARQRLAEALAGYRDGDHVALPAAVWLFTARA